MYIHTYINRPQFPHQCLFQMFFLVLFSQHILVLKIYEYSEDILSMSHNQASPNKGKENTN